MVATPAAAQEIRRSIELRATELEDMARRLRGPLGTSRPTLRTALDLVESSAEPLREVVAFEVGRNSDSASQIQILLPLLRHATQVANMMESHFSHGSHTEISEVLVDELHTELVDLGLPLYNVVVAHGPADNFTTLWGDLANAILGPLSLPITARSVNPLHFALFKIPRIEGGAIWWRPILAGHEVAHVAVSAFNSVAAFDLQGKFDISTAAQLDNPMGAGATAALGLFRIATSWATELLCDFHALRRFGPAAVAALAEYLTSIGATDAVSPSHPLTDLRVRLLVGELGPLATPRLRAIVEPWGDITPTQVVHNLPWVQYLIDLFRDNRAELMNAVAGYRTDAYDVAARAEPAGAVADEISRGIPGREILRLGSDRYQASTQTDVVNAAWIARTEGVELPVDNLARKAVELLIFVKRWMDAGGRIPVHLYKPPEATTAESGGALSEEAIENRLRTSGELGLTVTPLLQSPKGSGLDLRLGNRFIVFRRSSTTTFDPLDESNDPRAVQVYAELAWHEQFVLHPHELVLGATLEYLAIPPDLTAQVITRSSYGRLGLLSATAVQVHPLFRGCLTLELVNLSTIPLTLTPGERIAQLVLWRTDGVRPANEKYSCPIGPQFSKVQDDIESRVLRSMTAR